MIDYWFPTGIYRNNFIDNESVKSVVSNYIQEKYQQTDNKDTDIAWPYWAKMQGNILDPFQIASPVMDRLKDWIEQETNEFAKSFNSDDHYSIDQSWINIYDKEDFQETHYHLGFDFSAVYYVSIPQNSGNLIFENPLLQFNMRPIRSKTECELNSTSVIYKPIEGQLLIFRSNLRHGVLPHKSDIPRISIAVNLISKK